MWGTSDHDWAMFLATARRTPRREITPPGIELSGVAGSTGIAGSAGVGRAGVEIIGCTSNAS